MGRNSEAYVDDIVVKIREEHTLLKDLEETFASLRKVNLKLNPAKCIFGVPSGKLLSFLVSHRGIEANPNKTEAIEEMQPPRCLKDMQRLVGCMASLVRFISKFGEKALPFFKIMKRSGTFKWTPEADKPFEDRKKYLASPPIMVAPRPHEPWKLYLAATPQTVSVVLVVEREEPALPMKKVATPSPNPHDEEEVPPGTITPDETVLVEGQPLATLDKATEEITAAPPLKPLIEHPM